SRRVMIGMSRFRAPLSPTFVVVLSLWLTPLAQSSAANLRRPSTPQAGQDVGALPPDSTAARKAADAPKSKRNRRRSVSRGEVSGAARAPAAGWTSPRGTDALADDLGAAISKHTRSGQWGVIVVSLSRGDTLFRANPDAMMQPASTMKMYT